MTVLSMANLQAPDSHELVSRAARHPTLRETAVFAGGFLLGHAVRISSACVHTGSVTLRARACDCAYCHSVAQCAPSLFNRRENQKTREVYRSGWPALLTPSPLLPVQDHLSSIAMQYIPAGIAYPLYAGVSLVVAQCFNVLQLGSADPLRLGLGLGLVLLGLTFLTLAQSAKEQPEAAGGYMRDATLSLLKPSPALTGSLQHGPQSSSSTGTKAGPTAARMREPQRSKHIRPAPAMLMCVVAGLCGSGWSPLSTFARAGPAAAADPVHSAFVCLVVFELGQLCAIPSVAGLGGLLTGTGWWRPLRELGWAQVLWGLLCGVGVASGYAAYFISSAKISPTVAFGIVCCNPLLALLIDILRCEFKGGRPTTSTTIAIAIITSGSPFSDAPHSFYPPPRSAGGGAKLQLLLTLSIVFYGTAIVILASVPASSSRPHKGGESGSFSDG